MRDNLNGRINDNRMANRMTRIPGTEKPSCGVGILSIPQLEPYIPTVEPGICAGRSMESASFHSCTATKLSGNVHVMGNSGTGASGSFCGT